MRNAVYYTNRGIGHKSIERSKSSIAIKDFLFLLDTDKYEVVAIR